MSSKSAIQPSATYGQSFVFSKPAAEFPMTVARSAQS